MPKTKISEYSATANSNTDVASINIDEGCAPSGINNAIRAVMGHLKDFQQGTNGDPFNGPHNGTVGATTPSTGAFTTLSTTGNFTLGGTLAGGGNQINNVIIGTTNPLAGSFTTLSATGQTNLTGGALRIFGALDAGQISAGVMDWQSSTNRTRFLSYGPSGVRGQFAWITVIGGGAGTDAMVIDGNSNLQLQGSMSVGNATPTTSGAGITFPATQSASSNANTLDDYEEGTWTPTVGGTATYNTQTGSYTKVGRLVYVRFNLNILLIGTGSTQVVSGLPFTGSATRMAGSMAYWAGLSNNVLYLGTFVDNFGFNFISQTASGPDITDGAAILGSGTVIHAAAVYFV